MKRLIGIILMVALMAAGSAFADDKSRTSGKKTADATVYAASAELYGITVNTDGTNDCVVVIYDNASAASGTVLDEFTILGADVSGRAYYDALNVINGIYVDITTSGTCSYQVHYK
jgi:hypothetical protein